MEQAKEDAILAKITTGTNEIAADCDLIVEAALEKMDIKQGIFKQLDGSARPNAFLLPTLLLCPSLKLHTASSIRLLACTSLIRLLL